MSDDNLSSLTSRMFKFILAILIGIASAIVLDLNKDSFYSVVNGDADVLVEL